MNDQIAHDPGADLLKVAEVAAELRVSKMTVYRMIHDGTLPALQVGRSFRVVRRDLADYKRSIYRGGDQ